MTTPDPSQPTHLALTCLADFDARLGSAVRQGRLDAFWSEIEVLGQMPLIFGSTAVFLYRGPGEEVIWSGDWDGLVSTAKGYIPGSGLWFFSADLPDDARMEYVLEIDGGDGIPDPLNPHEEVGGLGAKSVVVMPGYTPPDYIQQHSDMPKGRLSHNQAIHSKRLGYAVHYRVYTPAGYANLERLPVLYVTDGQDFIAFGQMRTALDNLIAGGSVCPIIVVFIDPRDTHSRENLREIQFLNNPAYHEFIAKELVPAVDQAYRSEPSAGGRVIMGASYGGTHAASFILEHYRSFHGAAMLSPAFWYNDAGLIEEFRAVEKLPVRLYISTGTFHDTEEHARLMRDVLVEKGYELRYTETHEGHSYATWRGRFGELLKYFFGK
jgi:enterochelin esterase-like enzyme